LMGNHTSNPTVEDYESDLEKIWVAVVPPPFR